MKMEKTTRDESYIVRRFYPMWLPSKVMALIYYNLIFQQRYLNIFFSVLIV